MRSRTSRGVLHLETEEETAVDRPLSGDARLALDSVHMTASLPADDPIPVSPTSFCEVVLLEGKAALAEKRGVGALSKAEGA